MNRPDLAREPAGPLPHYASNEQMTLTQGVQITYPGAGRFDAIAEHGRAMARAFHEAGVPATFDSGGVSSIQHPRASTGWLIVSYQPYSYARWGVAPHLVAGSMFAARRRRGPRLALFVHEMYASDPRSLRLRTFTWWHREQVRRLARSVDLVFASTEANAAELQRIAPQAEILHAPIPSSIEPAGISREWAREQLKIGPADAFVVGLFGGGHESRALGHAARAFERLAQVTDDLVLINLGDRAPEIPVPRGVRVIQPGGIAAAEVSLHLSACDLYLAPFSDGVSTRRTTLSAALVHGLPVVGTVGPNTDGLLVDHPEAIALTAVSDVEAFASCAVALALDAQARCALGEAGKRLYDAYLSWPTGIARLSCAMGIRS